MAAILVYSEKTRDAPASWSAPPAALGAGSSASA